MGLLVLALVWQPALVVASEVHEAEHRVQAGHEHEFGSEAVSAATDDPAPDGRDPWHGLMHLGHCCGHVQALPAEGVCMPHVVRSSAAIRESAQSIANLPLASPLRPPIHG